MSLYINEDMLPSAAVDGMSVTFEQTSLLGNEQPVALTQVIITRCCELSESCFQFYTQLLSISFIDFWFKNQSGE